MSAEPGLALRRAASTGAEVLQRVRELAPCSAARRGTSGATVLLRVSQQRPPGCAAQEEWRGGCCSLEGDEAGEWARLEAMVHDAQRTVAEARQMTHTLYSYRSCAKAMAGLDAGVDETGRREMMRVLRAEASKITRLHALHKRVVRHSRILLESLSLGKNEFHEVVLGQLVDLLDVASVLDVLKDSKPGLQNDFSAYKRAVHSMRSEVKDFDALNQELLEVQQFLSDPRCAKGGVILFRLAQSIAGIRYIADALRELVLWCASRLAAQDFATPEQRWALLRVTAHLVVLLDICSSERHASHARVQKVVPPETFRLFRTLPVGPVYADVHVSVAAILAKCPNAATIELAALEPLRPQTPPAYDLKAHWPALRTAYDQCLCKLQSALQQQPQGSQDLVRQAVVEGLTLLALCKDLVLSQSAYLHATPAPEDTPSLLEHRSSPCFQYARIVCGRYDRLDREVLVDVVCMMKSLAALMAGHEPVLAPLLRLGLNARLRAFAGADLPRIAQLVDGKKRKAYKAAQRRLEQLIGEYGQPAAAQKPKRRVPLYVMRRRTPRPDSPPSPPPPPPAEAPPTAETTTIAVPPRDVQLALLQGLVRSLLRETSAAAGVAGGAKGLSLFGGNREATRSAARVLQELAALLRMAPLFLDLGEALARLSNVGELWFREFFLDITKSAQFPIDVSLPWVLTKEIVERPSSRTVNALWHVLDVYNDACELALSHFRQQFLVDEIEAEASLVVDQLLFLLPRHIYAHAKSVAAFGALDPVFRASVERVDEAGVGGREHERRYHQAVNRRCVSLLGRDLDMAALVTSRLEDILREDLEAAIATFQASCLSSIAELEGHLGVIRTAYTALRGTFRGVEMSSFDAVLACVDSRNGAQCLGGRIAEHVLSEIVMDVMPNLCFNADTGRFASPKQAAIQRRPKPRLAAPYLLYGTGATRWFEAQHRRDRGYLGPAHMDALVRVLGLRQLEATVAQLVQQVAYRVEHVVVPLARVLLAALPRVQYSNPRDPEQRLLDLQQAHAALFGRQDAVRANALGAFGGIGNALALVHQLQQALDRHDVAVFQTAGPLQGVYSLRHLGPAEDALSPAEPSPLIAVARHPGLRQHCLDLCQSASAAHANVSRRTLLFAPVLEQLDAMLKPHLESLAADPALNIETSPGTTPLPPPQPQQQEQQQEQQQVQQQQFHCLWSALQFLHLSSPDSGPGGDGFTWAGNALVQRMQQQRALELHDCSFALLDVVALDKQRQNLSASLAGFTARARRARRVGRNATSLCEAALPPQLCSSRTKNVTVFHPPCPVATCADRGKTTPGRKTSTQVTELEFF